VANITRIKNNQITDSTITAAKIATNTLTGGLFATNLTLNSNVTILGNLTVANSFAQLNSINTYINDPVVVFNNNYTGSPTYDIGMLINRNLNSLAPYGAVNAAFVWKEADTAFVGVMTTETGTTAGAINNSGFANLKVGNVTANSLTITTGSITASNGITGTPISGSTGYFTTAQATNFSTANAVITGGYVNGLANVTATQATVTNFFSGNITGNFTQGSLNGTVPTANVSLYDSFTASTTNATFYPQIVDKTTGNGAGFTASTLTHNPSTGALSATSFNGIGTFSTATTSGTLIASGNIVAASGTASTNTTTGAVVVVGGAGISGAIYAGSIQNTPIGSTTASTGAFTTGTFSSTLGVTGATTLSTATAGGLQAQAIGNVTPGSGAFTTGTFSSTLGVTGATTLSTATAGGLQAQAIGNVTPGSGAFTTASTSGNLTVGGNIAITGNIVPSANVTYSLGTSGLRFKDLYLSGQTQYIGGSVIGEGTDGNLTLTTATGNRLTIASTANVIVTTGNIGAPYLLGNAYGTTGTFLGTGTSTSTTTGAVVVTGGVGVGGNLYVGGISVLNGNVSIGGNLTVTGQSVTIGASTLSINDPIINLNTPSDLTPLTTPTTADIGLKFHYYDTVDSAAFLGRTTADGFLTWYSRGTDTANVFAGTVLGTTKSGAAIIANAKTVGGGLTANTGTFQVYGDGSISGNLYIGATTTTATVNATTSLITATLNAGTIGNAGAAFSGASSTLTGTAIATTVNAGTIGNIGANLVGTGTYLTSLTGSNVNGTVATANVSLYDNITPYTTNQTFYLQFANVTNGNTSTGATTNINVNPSTGNVSATAFVGSGAYLTNISIGALSGTYPTANVAIYDQVTNLTNNQTYYLEFANVVSGNSVTGAVTTVNVNPSTGTLSATTFSGAISSSMVTTALGFTPYNNTNPSGYQTSSGSVNSATYATQASSVNINTSTSSTAYYPVLTDSVAGGAQNEYVDGNGILKYTPSTGNLTTANLVTTWGANINVGQNTGNGADLYVLGKNTTSLIWARSSTTYDQVLIGNSATASTLVRGAKLQINSTDSMMIPSGTTAQRPSSTGGTDTTGMLRFNTTSTAMEVYNGSSWQSLSTQFTVIATDSFNGDGSTTAFTMAASSTTNGAIVSINGIVQIPTTAYSCSGTTLTFTEAPASGDVIDVRRLTTTSTITAISGTNGYMGFYADNNGAYVTTGTGSANNTTYWDTSGAEVNAVGNVTVASANTATTVDTMSTSTYRSAKYIVQVTNGTNYQVMEALLISNGTTATVTTYGTIQTNGNLGVLSATQSGSNSLLQFIATNATNIVRIKKDYLVI